MPLQKSKRIGRPVLPKSHNSADISIVPIRFSPEDLKLIEKAAKASKVTVSEWISDAIEAKVRRSRGRQA
jgi:predicted HicB family RNase H-like nuclease